MKKSRKAPAREAELIAHWMTRKPHVVSPGDSVTRAVTMLEEHGFNQLPVVSGGTLVGIVTDRDLRDAWSIPPTGGAQVSKQSPEMDADRIKVEALMTRDVVAAGPDDTLERAAWLMRDRRIGALPVVKSGRLEGIITRSDILDAFLRRQRT